MKQEKHILKGKANPCKMQVITYVNTWGYSKVFSNTEMYCNITSSKLIGKNLRDDAAQKKPNNVVSKPLRPKKQPKCRNEKNRNYFCYF